MPESVNMKPPIYREARAQLKPHGVLGVLALLPFVPESSFRSFLNCVVKIFHAADIHLGRRRLGGRLPDKDFAEAFAFMAGRAVAEGADVFLFAGDLFDRAQVEPPHLRQAQQVLAQLKRASIPVVAIEGNHDKAFLNSSLHWPA